MAVDHVIGAKQPTDHIVASCVVCGHKSKYKIEEEEPQEPTQVKMEIKKDLRQIVVLRTDLVQGRVREFFVLHSAANGPMYEAIKNGVITPSERKWVEDYCPQEIFQCDNPEQFAKIMEYIRNKGISLYLIRDKDSQNSICLSAGPCELGFIASLFGKNGVCPLEYY